MDPCVSQPNNINHMLSELFRLRQQQLISLLAGFVCMLIYGSAYTYGTLIPYVTSYLYHSGDHEITTNKMASLLLISILILNVGMPLCNIRKLQFTNRITTLISIVGVCGSILLVSFGDQFWHYLVVYGIIFGIFIGFGYLAPIKNCYSHIPHLKGLCSGVCILGYGISSLLFNFILLALINPNNQSPHDQGGRKIYSPEVANNVPFALRIMSGIYLVIGLMGVALMQAPFQPQDAIEVVKDKGDDESLLSVKQTSEPLLGKREMTLREVVKVVLDKKIIWLVVTLTSSIPFGMFIAFNYKEYGLIELTNDSFLTVIGSCGAIFNGLGRFFWGFMLDRFSFRIISSLINGILMVAAVTASLAVQNQYFFLIAVSVIYFCYGGNYAVYPTQTMRVFGQELGGKVYYIVFTGFSFGCLIQWLSRILLVPESPKEAKFDGFTTCFYIFAGFNLLSLMLSLFVKYEYEEPPAHQGNKA